jgi:hypothetical protein
MLANARHHRGAVEFDNRERGFYHGLPLLEILLGLGALLDVFGGVLEGDDLATTGQGNGIVELRFQPVALSATRPPPRPRTCYVPGTEPSDPMERGEAVPQKETRESIEAELNASKRERIALQLQELIREAHLVENDLRSLEDEYGIPEFARSRPLPERMAAVGMSRAVIDRVSKSLDALDMVRQGRSDDLPDDVKNELAGQADAELSGAEQLAAIVDQQRKG